MRNRLQEAVEILEVQSGRMACSVLDVVGDLWECQVEVSAGSERRLKFGEGLGLEL